MTRAMVFLFGFAAGTVFLNEYCVRAGYWLAQREWHCTDSRVINDTLPRQEECVEYRRKSDG